METFHVTTPYRARQIHRHGFTGKPRAGMGQGWGPGIYLARDRETALIYEDFADYSGNAHQTLECEVELKTLFRLTVRPEQIELRGAKYRWDAGTIVFAAVGPDALAEYQARVDEGGFSTMLNLVREMLIERGHDGLLIDDPTFHTAIGGNQAIVYDPSLIRVTGIGEPVWGNTIVPRSIVR